MGEKVTIPGDIAKKYYSQIRDSAMRDAEQRKAERDANIDRPSLMTEARILFWKALATFFIKLHIRCHKRRESLVLETMIKEGRTPKDHPIARHLH